MTYNPWPLGELPRELQRPEPEMIRDEYPWDDPRDIIDIFEKKVAKFAGSKYAVAVDSCTHALFLSLFYVSSEHLRSTTNSNYSIPRNTYVSVLQTVKKFSHNVRIKKRKWRGVYRIKPTRVYDAALRWTKGMYIPGSLMCLSFQIKKRIPIGRGGMILCDTKEEYEWLKLASYDGRDLNTPYDSPGHVKMDGWHYYMTPEDAARGILLMDMTPEVNEDQGGWQNYPPLQHR